MYLQFNYATGNWKKGEIVEIVGPRAEYFIRIGAAHKADDPPVERATAVPLGETADAPPPAPRKRGRPRKVLA